ncbi:MAG: nitronate monooxygenase [Kurthia sp.]|nr:nitronate monooxygenase [Candidatus Kurthia equi]
MKYPIIQAPMAGITTAEMVIESLEAGILGSIGAGYMSGDETRQIIREVKKHSNKPFMINLFAHEMPRIVQHEINIAKQALIDANVDEQTKRDQINLSITKYEEQVEAVIEEGVAVCSFTFGLPTPLQVRQLHEHGVLVFVTATSPDEVRMSEEIGVDAICLQGAEAGGHRGSFIEPFQYMPLNDLLAHATKLTTKPLIVAGGIATKQQIENYLQAGAQAVMLGTVFVVSEESGAASAYKEAILNATNDQTVITKAFSGKPARGIRNSFIDKMEMLPVAPFPYQNDLTKGIRARAVANHRAENLSLWAGTSLYLAQPGKIKDIVKRLTE